ncbi:hypothetical protein CAPTEDRAFT_1618 [Capitella teleta]|uniref:NADP-dependent oxidoreductase domain-containing protein n=1 Tax=Capitella teleta TaxID=283909 RepID=X1Z9A8_CAPTE|nr:hypothetical protein CAPTEDRAFT_1618 [Capitella teleta]|eukprot:ELU10115.1 hypothetical protein CAPTEDRAFT_1618 [Capitella teleta]
MDVPCLKLSAGNKIPILGLGTWQSKPGEVGNVVKSAIDAGYRHLDCAWFYQNEAEIGAALKTKFQEGVVKREDMFITGKIWRTKMRYEDCLASLKNSLKSYDIEYLDLCLVHWPIPHQHDGNDELMPTDDKGDLVYSNTSYLETWKALEKAVDDGLVKAIGLSNFNSRQIDDVIRNGRIKPSVLQVEVHPYLSQEKLVKFCQERDIVVTAFSPFGSPDRPWATPDEPILLEDPQLLDIAKKYKKSSAQVIIRWLIQRNIVVVPKSANPARIRENFNVWDFTLSEDDMAVISSFNRDYRFIVFYKTVNGQREFAEKDAPNFPFADEF